jgi:hypothetical protein
MFDNSAPKRMLNLDAEESTEEFSGELAGELGGEEEFNFTDLLFAMAETVDFVLIPQPRSAGDN